MRILALDIGEHRVGLAISDPIGILATPQSFFNRTSPNTDAKRIVTIANELNAGCILAGMPFSLAGEMGFQAQKIQQFLDVLRPMSSVPIEIWDERFSTVKAESLLRETGKIPSMNKGLIDATAAAVILQHYLDHRKEQCKEENFQ